MRLIDAEALSELLVKTYEKAPTEKALLFVALLLKNNEQVPTIDIPIRYKGEWIEREQKTMGAVISYNVCSYCNMKQSIKWNFCPNCGADMRGEKK